MSHWEIAAVSAAYLTVLFGVAYLGERRARLGRSLLNNPYIYALSLAVYCSAWTYFGSVGLAARQGVSFLPIYLGPLLVIPLWSVLMRKILRISKVQRTTSIADFISSRYGRSTFVGGLVALICVLGVVPYISLQLKAITVCVDILTGEAAITGATPTPTRFFHDTAFFIATGLAFFIILFGARQIDAAERHEGMVTAIAFESIVKLLAFLAIGVFVTFGLFSGPVDIFRQAAEHPAWRELFVMSADNQRSWPWHMLVSALAVMLLPRQFQVTVVENVNEQHLKKAMWLFPLYLLTINLFVLPIALGGNLLLAGTGVDADTYVLTIPMSVDQPALTLLAYIGGFSAATSMVIVATIALSTMLSNHLILPWLIRSAQWRRDVRFNQRLVLVRQASIIFTLLLAYLYYHTVGTHYNLASIGLISFTAVAQFAPATFGGLFWKRGTRTGATLGLLAGFLVWAYTLPLPTLVEAKLLAPSLLTEGPFGYAWLRPRQLLGMEGLDPISHALFWSLLANIGWYLIGSFYSRQTAKEHNQAEVFVDIFRYSSIYESSLVWKGTAYVLDLKTLLSNFLGVARTEQALESYARRFQLKLDDRHKADPSLVNYAEKLLSGVIGAASARVMISSAVQEEPIQMNDVMHILRESQYLLAYNKDLKVKSDQLRQMTSELTQANEQLKALDQQKDEFITTVTHELRTPLTSIRAMSEILYDNPDLPEPQKERFLQTLVNESERLTRLISQVLDLERLESRQQQFTFDEVNIKEIMEEVVVRMQPLARDKNVNLHRSATMTLPSLRADRDRLLQLLINLVSNAIKYCDPKNGDVIVTAYYMSEHLYLSVRDNGMGIDAAYHRSIFERFQQVKQKKNSDLKPDGSGLGLAICQKIVEYHGGRIWVESEPGRGAKFVVSLPTKISQTKLPPPVVSNV